MDAEEMKGSFLVADLTDSTSLLYQAANGERNMVTVTEVYRRFFQNVFTGAQHSENVHIINTTGDGFLAIIPEIPGTRPSRTLVEFASRVRRYFEKDTKPMLGSLPFRQEVNLRMALHHGHLYRIRISKGKDQQSLYIGDDLNLAARVANSQTARDYGIAITNAFYNRLMLLDRRSESSPHELIRDRNIYPRHIPVFRLPEVIPVYPPQATIVGAASH